MSLSRKGRLFLDMPITLSPFPIPLTILGLLLGHAWLFNTSESTPGRCSQLGLITRLVRLRTALEHPILYTLRRMHPSGGVSG